MNIPHPFAIAVLGICSIALLGCKFEKATTAVRPDNVPVEAIWGGGVDGGTWLHCLPPETPFRYYCEVYDDFSGVLIWEDFFQLKIVNWNDETERPEYSSLDSYKILPSSSFNGASISIFGQLELIAETEMD